MNRIIFILFCDSNNYRHMIRYGLINTLLFDQHTPVLNQTKDRWDCCPTHFALQVTENMDKPGVIEELSQDQSGNVLVSNQIWSIKLTRTLTVHHIVTRWLLMLREDRLLIDRWRTLVPSGFVQNIIIHQSLSIKNACLSDECFTSFWVFITELIYYEGANARFSCW